MKMTRDDIKNFVQDLFTLRTVWIDKGSGKWTVKKRFHPLLRSTFWVLAVIFCAGIYSGINSPQDSEAVAEQNTVMTTAALPEPEEISPAPPVQPQQLVIPLKASAKHSEIILPSEANPETDRIIPPSPPKPRRDERTVEKPSGKYSIKVSKSTYTLTLYNGDTPVKEYPIAVGKNPGDKQKVGDNRTPVGNFKVVSIENASNWSHDFRDGKGIIKGAYGPWFLRLDAKGWKGIGIHGTHDPDSRGTNATEGCIRLSNEDIAELKQYAYKNMPVTISEN